MQGTAICQMGCLMTHQVTSTPLSEQNKEKEKGLSKKGKNFEQHRRVPGQTTK